MRTFIYPGSFDPPTLGHRDIVRRASLLCDRLIVAVLTNPAKRSPMFTSNERIELLKGCLSDIENAEFIEFDGLLADLAEKADACAVVRGVRGAPDIEYELQMAMFNRSLNGRLETVFLPAADGLSYITSSAVREVASFGRDVSNWVPENVAQKVRERLEIKA